MLSKILTSITDAYVTGRKAKAEVKQAEVKLKIAELTARAEIQKELLQSDNDYDVVAQKERGKTWLDEFLGVVITTPFIVVNVNLIALMVGWTDTDHTLFLGQALSNLPANYWYAFWGIIIAVFGLKSLARDLAALMVSKVKSN